MLAKSTKLILILCLPMTLLLSILACVSSSDATSSDPNRTSIKDLDITMDVNQLEEFRAQIRKFAEKHSLEYTEKLYNKDKTYFFAFMEGDDFQIVLANSTNNLGKVGIGLFNKASPPLSQEALDELVNDLKSFINEIPNVTIIERIKSLEIRIDETQRRKIFAELFDQLPKLADKHSLEFTALSYDDSYWETFLVKMQGEGFRITIKSVTTSREINLIFYMDFDNNVIPTTTPTPQETLDELVNDLKSYLGEIPNVTITEGP